MIAFFLAAAVAPEPAETPSVPMEVAKARVEMVKTMLASAGGDQGGALKAISGASANANIGGTISALTPSAIAPLRSCTRNGAFTVSENGVMVRMACSGSLPANSTVLVTFAEEKIVSVVAGPSAPAVAGEGTGQ